MHIASHWARSLPSGGLLKTGRLADYLVIVPSSEEPVHGGAGAPPGFVMPSVFSWPVVTKGCFPFVTVALTQARANPAPAREAWGTRQGPATDKEGTPPLGCRCCLHSSQFPPHLRTVGFSPALSPGTGPKHSRTPDTPVGVWEIMIPAWQSCGPQPGCYLGPRMACVLDSGRTQGPEVIRGEVFAGRRRAMKQPRSWPGKVVWPRGPGQILGGGVLVGWGCWK